MALSKLKPLRNLGAFDGEKYKADIPRDLPIQKTCTHRDVQFVNGELRCRCGAAWTGPGLELLYKALKAQ